MRPQRLLGSVSLSRKSEAFPIILADDLPSPELWMRRTHQVDIVDSDEALYRSYRGLGGAWTEETAASHPLLELDVLDLAIVPDCVGMSHTAIEKTCLLPVVRDSHALAHGERRFGDADASGQPTTATKTHSRHLALQIVNES